jgi:hypothetical protein
VEEISLDSAEVTNTWSLNLPSGGHSLTSAIAMHLSEEDRTLHLAFASGLYCRLKLDSSEESVAFMRTVSEEKEADALASRWHFTFGQSPEKASSLILFGVSSQGTEFTVESHYFVSSCNIVTREYILQF